MLERFRRDFCAVTGRAFTHFFCPITYEDIPVELCMGHILSKSLAGAVRTQVVQRKDVDNFYGTVAEAEVAAFIAARDKSEAVLRGRLGREPRLRILLDGRDVPYHRFEGHKDPQQSLLHVEHADGSATQFVLHMTPDEMKAASKGRWEFAVFSDCRAAAIGTLIKAAHLTLFHVLGYSYVCSAAGEFVGRQILGTFFQENHRKPVREIKALASAHFLSFEGIVRPVLGNAPFRGTVEDHKVIIAYAANGRAFGIGVLVRTGRDLHCVLVPEFTNADAGVYLRFLEHPEDALRVKEAEFDRKKRVWLCSTKPASCLAWPKSDAN